MRISLPAATIMSESFMATTCRLPEGAGPSLFGSTLVNSRSVFSESSRDVCSLSEAEERLLGGKNIGWSLKSAFQSSSLSMTQEATKRMEREVKRRK